jgi:hypothetical protein
VELAWGPACHITAATNTSASRKSGKVVTRAFSKSELGEQFTVVILSMARRVAMLEQVLREYDGWPSIAEIIVVMNGLSEDHVASRWGVTKTPISFVNNSVNSLNSRYNYSHNKHSRDPSSHELTTHSGMHHQVRRGRQSQDGSSAGE